MTVKSHSFAVALPSRRGGLQKEAPPMNGQVVIILLILVGMLAGVVGFGVYFCRQLWMHWRLTNQGECIQATIINRRNPHGHLRTCYVTYRYRHQDEWYVHEQHISFEHYHGWGSGAQVQVLYLPGHPATCTLQDDREALIGAIFSTGVAVVMIGGLGLAIGVFLSGLHG